VIAAAGNSSRAGLQVNKLLYNIHGKPIIAYTLEIFQKLNCVDEIILVVKKNEQIIFEKIVEDYNFTKVTKFVIGGATRQDSVHNGIESLEAEPNDIVLIHNGSNIFVTPDEIMAVIIAADRYGASVLGFPAKDTVKQYRKGFVDHTVPRSELWQVQTPQVMKYKLAKEAFDKAYTDGFQGTDDVSLVERLDKKVKLVKCSYKNFKITTRGDLELAEAMLLKTIQDIKRGIGQDSQLFIEKEPLVLGGVTIDDKCCEANSDEDVVLHALSDALISAIGKGSAYVEEMCAKYGINDSKGYVKKALEFVKRAGYKVANVAIRIETKRPTLEKFTPYMERAVSRLLQITDNAVGITTINRKELGVQALAVVSIIPS